MQMAPGAISNFTIPKVVGATFTAYLACLPASQLLPLRLPSLVSPSTRRIQPPPSAKCPAKKFPFSVRGNRSPRTIPRARIPVMFARLLYLNEKRTGVSSRVFSPTPFRSECQRAELIYRASPRCTCDYSGQRRLLIESSAGLLDGVVPVMPSRSLMKIFIPVVIEISYTFASMITFARDRASFQRLPVLDRCIDDLAWNVARE